MPNKINDSYKQILNSIDIILIYVSNQYQENMIVHGFILWFLNI